MAMGGGVDFAVNRALAGRIGQFEYTHSWLPNVDQIRASEGVRFYLRAHSAYRNVVIELLLFLQVLEI